MSLNFLAHLTVRIFLNKFSAFIQLWRDFGNFRLQKSEAPEDNCKSLSIPE
jgi:hypothetical protein